MNIEPMGGVSSSGQAPAARSAFGAGANVFRDAWEYRITEAGAQRLAARAGASPAFLGILSIVSAAPLTFGHIALATPHIDGDDLELFLSTMCEMGLLAPVEGGILPATVPNGVALPEAGRATADVEPPRAALVDDDAATVAALPVVLLVHAEARVRANWRRLLTGRGFELLEGSELAVVERLLRERRPAWVVLGLHGEDFEGLHLLRALKRPRAPRFSRVCLVVPRGRVLAADAAETAARADGTASSGSDIVRVLCGADALGEGFNAAHEVAAQAGHVAAAAQPRACEPVPTVTPAWEVELSVASAASAVAGKPANPPANAPAWMNLLYGDAFKYGSFESDHSCDLEAHYPRLMLRMIEGWSKPQFGAEINQLIVNERGGRGGFPPHVMDELWFLYQVHQTLHTGIEPALLPCSAHVYPAEALLQPDGITGSGAAIH